MPYICYEPKRFTEEQMGILTKVNMIAADYLKKGFDLTLRQLYYIFVGNKLFPESWKYRKIGPDKWVRDPNGTVNATPNYKNLGKLITDGRMAGLVDWNYIVDRTRSSYANQHWARPSQILEATHNTYALDKWANQPNHVEVWVEKEALENVLSNACSPLDVRFFACKGYTSASAMWAASERLVQKAGEGKAIHIIHLGDHDPSGVDMTRDIEERLNLFVRHVYPDADITVHRIALTMAQVEEYQLPPDPAKKTDPRHASYQEQYGDESWELDALEPELLVRMIQRKILSLRDEKLWEEQVSNERRGKHTLECLIKYFPDVVGFLRERRKRDDSEVICQGCGATRANPRCQCVDGEVKGVLL